MLSTNPNHLERWLQPGNVEHISRSMRGWYGPPIALDGVPGNVWATKDGDFIGECKAGWEMSALDKSQDVLRRIKRAARIATGPEKRLRLNAGFASLSDLISEVTQNAKLWRFDFNKVGTTGVVAATNSLWGVGAQPSAGASPGAGTTRTPTSSTAGAFAYTNPAGSDTLHLVSAWPIASLVNTLLCYDRLWDFGKTASSSGTEATTGAPAAPTRYTSLTSTDPDYIAGNFAFVECLGALFNAAHNWTTCLYKDQADGSSTFPSLTGNAACIINRLDHPTNQWFMPLEAGDIGVEKITQVQCSVNTITGTAVFVIGHPLCWMPCQLAGQMCQVDCINTAFSMVRIFNSACLAFLEVLKPATGATTYTGSLIAAAG